jgi:hypothetical protein
MPFNKASLHGPNRAANLKSNKHWDSARQSPHYNDDSTQSLVDVSLDEQHYDAAKSLFRIKSINALREEFPEKDPPASFGHAAIIRRMNGDATEELLKQHYHLTGMNSGTVASAQDSVLIHFHDLPVYILRVIFIDDELNVSKTSCMHDEESFPRGKKHGLDWIYLSEAHLYNHKICGG